MLPRDRLFVILVNLAVRPVKFDSVAIGGNDQESDETASEDLQQTRISFDLWSSFWSNLGFVAVMLLAGCVYLSRKDF